MGTDLLRHQCSTPCWQGWGWRHGGATASLAGAPTHPQRRETQTFLVGRGSAAWLSGLQTLPAKPPAPLRGEEGRPAARTPTAPSELVALTCTPEAEGLGPWGHAWREALAHCWSCQTWSGWAWPGQELPKPGDTGPGRSPLWPASGPK